MGLAITPLINQVSLKNIPEGWEVRSIDSVCLQVTSGGTPSRKISAYWENGTIPWLKTSELKDAYIITSEEKITKTGLENSSAKLFPVNTVLMAMYGDGRTITSLGILGREATTNQACCAMIADPTKCHYRYLFYALQYHRSEILNLATGSSQRNLSGQKIKQCGIFLPPLPIQRKIAAILSVYDDLIENSLRRIKILEEMAQNLYREWFVKFRFPGHEKARFVDSPLGRIPEGWEMVKLAELIEIRKGKNITRNTILQGSVPVVAGGMSPAYYHNAANTRQPVITISASGANAGFVCLYHENIWASDCSVIDLDTTPNVYFFYLQLKHRQIEVTRLQRGAAQPHVYPKDLLDLDAIRIPSDILEGFNQDVISIMQMIRNLTLKNTTLRRTRDLLLPKLISGEVDVSDLDITVPEEASK